MLCELTDSAVSLDFFLVLQGRAMATCVDNITESRKELSGYVCQSTIVPSDIRGQTVVSSQPFSIGDTLSGEICKCPLWEHSLR